MATTSETWDVKSLNKSSGSRRFVFKSFSQRLEEIDINVFRSIDPLKPEPSEGSSFFRDCLVEWRELNTAEDFISFYEEMMPCVQTLQQVLHHREEIITKLLLKLQIKARLSLEPILRLIAALSRDLLDYFRPFLPRITEDLVTLLKTGAEKEPDILEQIFTSWSCLMMYLQKYLVRDVVDVLKITADIRYYPKVYVQEFMAEAVSFLLRNAPEEQLKKGIKWIICEVVEEPTDERKSGVSALLFYIMRGAPSRLHSRAEKVLLFLFHNSTFTIGDKFDQGSDTILAVLSTSFERLAEDLQPKELNLIFSCLLDKIYGCVSDESNKHLSYLLYLLNSFVKFGHGGKIVDYKRMLELVESLVKKYVVPSDGVKIEVPSSEIADRVLQLMPCLLDVLHNCNDELAMSSVPLQWAPVFELRNPSLLDFIGEVLCKDPCVAYPFGRSILSALSDMIEAYPLEVMYLMLRFVERLQAKMQSSKSLGVTFDEESSKVHTCLQRNICDWINKINLARWDSSSTEFHEYELAALWGTLRCYPDFVGINENPSLIMDLVVALDQLLTVKSDSIAGLPKRTWHGLVGAALASYHKLHLGSKSGLSETGHVLESVLDFAKRYRSCFQVLFAVADFLDSMYGLPCQADSNKVFHPVLSAERALDAINIFAENLCHSDKEVRISTLKILCHYEPLDSQFSINNQPAQKKLKIEGSQSSCEVTQCSNVLQLLLSIEATPISISTSRKVIVLLSRIQMSLSSDRISEEYVPLLLNGIIGIFHNRFSHLWEPAMECLALLINKYTRLVWDRFICYLGECQLGFVSSHNKLERAVVESSSKSKDMVDCFNSFVMPDSDSTPCMSVLSLLLKSLQKVSTIAESRSRQLIPLFFKFLGYSNDYLDSVGSFISDACKGKEWKEVLKEWLNLLKLMRNPKSLYCSDVLHDILINRLLDENDADIQMKVLDCLLNWKDGFLLPYDQHLKNLIASKNLREELATWSLSKESHSIQEQHRVDLIPLVIQLLIPKVRKLKTLASRKNASIQHRRAVLCFLAQLDVDELPPLFTLLIKPLRPVPEGSKDINPLFWSRKISTDRLQESNLLECFTADNMAKLSWKKRYGFLHVIEDILKVFDELHLGPFLNLLMGCVVRILGSCTSNLVTCNESSFGSNLSSDEVAMYETVGEAVNPVMTCTATKQFKDVRSFCLKIISFTLNKYGDHDFGNEFWDIFFTAVKPLIDGFKQEGSSSERPSSLFSCFVAMSKSCTLVSLLYREENLVPTIFSILTVKTASYAIITCVLGFIENLLNLDNDLDNNEDCSVKRVLLPNLEALIFSLHHLFQCRNGTGRRLFKCPGKGELRIFKLLPKYIKDPLTARPFLDILLPFLVRKTQKYDEYMEGLEVIRRIVPVLGSETTGKILNAISSLLIYARLDVRLSICNLLDGLAVNDPSIVSLAELVRELNAMSSSEIDEVDYDTRVSAYEKINPKYFEIAREEHAMVILSHCVFDMSSEDLILRQCGTRSLLSFIQFAPKVLCSGAQDWQQVPESAGALDSDVCWTKESIQRIVKKFLLKHMGDAMIKEISIQREWIALLQEMVLKLPEVPALNSLKSLCSEDAEVDFFNNILHLQKHRRARALLRFRNVIRAGDLSEIIVNKVFLPLFFNMLFDVQDGKGEHVRNACVETLASITGHMQWESYHEFLIRCFREITSKPNKEKVLLRLICSVLDQFHFSDNCYSQELKHTASEVSNPVVTGMGSSLVLQRCSNSTRPTDIQSCLHKTVLPKIQKLLDADTGKVNVTISLIALKLLKLLPVDTMESQLPSIIHRISNFLKNRLESIRDEARSALAACCKELGMEYFQFIVRVLRATLKRGFELHILGYTLNFLLSKSLLSPVVGKLDYCFEELLRVAENDILGDVAEEKEVEKIASKMKETRKRKSFETLKLIAQNITFKTNALKLLLPVKAHLHKHLTPKMKAKLETMLNHIAAGIECNPSVEQTELFIFVYGLIEDGTGGENRLGKDSSAIKPSKQFGSEVGSKRNSSEGIIADVSQNLHLITVFALGVLQNRLKNMKFDKKDGELLSLLDPFVNLLGNCLSSKYEDILSGALRCLAPLIRLPLPSLDSQADNIKILLLDIAQKSGNTSSPLTQSCLRLLTVLLRGTSITLSSDQLHMLVQFPLFVDLERNPSFLALSLLKAIVGRKLVFNEIYDLVKQVETLMVTSLVEPIRKKCSQILLQFLLDYYLDEKRLHQHLDYVIDSLSYEHSFGREAALEMLHAIIIKFPKSTIDEEANVLFFKLVVCLANDHDYKVRSMVGAVIKLLIGRISQQSVVPILKYTLSWYMGDKQNLWSAAAQVLGLLVEALKKRFQRHINKILPVTKNILKSAFDVVRDKQLDYSDEGTILFWKEAYYSLVMLEKMLLQFPELHLKRDLQVSIWKAIREFLLHPHMWLRNISSRLVALYFAAASEASQANKEKSKQQNLLLMKPSTLFEIAVSLCCQLKAQLTDDSANNILTQNLVFTICGVHSLVGQRDCMDLQSFWSSLKRREQGCFLESLHLLGSRKERDMFVSLTFTTKHQGDQDSIENLQSLLVSPLLKRMGKIALQMEDIQMKIVFNAFRMISSQIGQEGSQHYAFHMLLPLYKVCEGFTGKVITDDVKQLAEEVRENIQRQLGNESFVRVYNEIRRTLKAKRDKRKQEEKLMAVINPMRNAKRKLRLAAKHSAHKKRKIMSMKIGIWRR
ncbi:small subunit processome component 20 homolog [Telopea speciosissima]|uniref:small subunit processome component 20 homolog n=1 Tax=Telopea speciosissima TaxID=54955 RepID=UPI001CC50854|nr:small subunit processome component 20 homolog [Telopea speciosissima]